MESATWKYKLKLIQIFCLKLVIASKNFEIKHYTGKMFNPFGNIPDNALGHYYVQLPLYGRLLNKMLEGTKFEPQKVLGSVVVLLKDDKTYVEYKVPPEVHYNVYKLDLSKHIKRW